MLNKPAELLSRLEQSGLLSSSIVDRRSDLLTAESAEQAADQLVRLNLLTEYQARVAVQGESVPLSIGDYIVEDMIGRGGMGYVLKARHRRMKRLVAIKFLQKSMTESPDLVARFEREVEAAAQLHHPNIVTAYDAGEHDGSHYLVMQYVDGEDLSHRVKRDGPLTVSEAIDVIRQAAHGLGYAHEKGIVHRDIKPGNLLLDREGVLRILDMGLARMKPAPGDAIEGGAHADLTNTGSVMGTIDYMAPEQALDSKSADARADIYALGCTLYFLLTGNPPFRSDTIMRRLLAHREGEIPLITQYRPEAPRELDRIFAKMMAKDREERFASTAHLATALESLELDESAAGQMATIDAADDGTGGFIKLPEGDLPDESVATLDFGDSSATTPTGSAIRPPASIAPDATVVASDSQVQQTVVVSDADSLAQAESTSDAPSADAPSSATGSPELPPSREARGGSQPPWKVIVPAIAAVMVVAVLYVISQNGEDASETSGSLTNAGAQSVTEGNKAASQDRQSGTPADSNDTAIYPDRRAARWVLSIGGTVRVTVGQQTVTATEPGQLPDEPFLVDTVELAGNPRVTDEGLKNLQGLSGLRVIAAWDTPISDAGLANLTDSGKRPLPNLRSLQLERTQITDTGLSYLTESPIDKFLALGSTAISDPNLLRNFADATNLNIGVTSIPLSRLDFLTDFSRLTALSLDARQWNALAAETPPFAESLLNLSVYVRSNSRVDERLLRKTPHLIGLSMSGPVESQFDEAFWTALAALPDLEELRLDAEISDDALTHVQRMSELHTLHLDSTTITGEGFAKAAQQLLGLRTLNLTNGSLTDNDVPSLATLKTLQQFNLKGNQITAEGVASLRRALADCRIISDHGTFEPTGSTPSKWALSFDGKDDYVQIPNLRLDQTQPLTIEAWVTPRSIGKNSAVVSGGGIALNSHPELSVWNIVAHNDSDGWAFARKDDHAIVWNKRVHLAATFANNRLAMFIDGKLVAQKDRVKFRGWASDVFLGADQTSIANAWNTGFLDGVIDEIRISDSERYSAGFSPDQTFTSDAKTLALYHFDAGQGTVLKDSSGNGRNGTIHGATWEQVAAREPAPLDGQRDRAAAEWVLKRNGFVVVKPVDDDKGTGVQPGEPLPKWPFHLIQINLNKSVPEDEFVKLAGLPSLEAAYINYFPLTDAALANLRSSTKLRALHMEGTQITTHGLDILQHFPALESLHLPAGLTDEAVPKILAAKHLERLTLGFKSDRIPSLSRLPELSRLKSLILHYTDVTSAGSGPGSLKFVHEFQNLTTLGLSRSRLNTQCLRELAKQKQLKTLFLRDDKFDADALHELSLFQHLDSLTVTGASLGDADIGPLTGLTNLKSLDVQKNDFTSDGIATLRKSLPGCRLKSDHGSFEASSPNRATP